MTADQIADVQKATAEAVAKGDGTLTGEAGAKVAEKVAENAVVVLVENGTIPSTKKDEVLALVFESLAS